MISAAAERSLGFRPAFKCRHNDLGHLKKHVFPAIGDLALADIRARHIRGLVRTWRTNTQIAPRTLRNTYSVIHTLFRDAAIEELIPSNPCIRSGKELGPNENKDPEWRATAVYDRDEIIKLISFDLLPADRRTMYAVLALAGLRHGDLAGLRWRTSSRTWSAWAYGPAQAAHRAASTTRLTPTSRDASVRRAGRLPGEGQRLETADPRLRAR